MLYFYPPTSTTSTTTTTTSPPEPTATGLSPQQPGIIDTCNKFHMVATGDTCAAIAVDNRISLADFYAWNPAVGADCRALWGGYYVCVGVPGKPHNASQCATTTTTTTTTSTTTAPSTGPRFRRVVGGDTCQGLQQEYGISAAQFNAWNPGVGSNCASLWAGYFVCVGV
ncbi:hypothetical protein BJX63DRAFT_417677 [Aspergillus granulosus]|uniref:LysM domain-containing protein n=1 Tax=Aspergillus granulosus TaxID=176169 RepID=A0ABR4I4H4_9EURO